MKMDEIENDETALGTTKHKFTIEAEFETAEEYEAFVSAVTEYGDIIDEERI